MSETNIVSEKYFPIPKNDPDEEKETPRTFLAFEPI